MSKRIREEDATRKAHTKDIALFLKPGSDRPNPRVSENFESRVHTPAVKRREVEHYPERTLKLYEPTPKKPKFEIVVDDDDDDDSDAVEEEVKDFVRKNFCEIASTILTPYIYRSRFHNNFVFEEITTGL